VLPGHGAPRERAMTNSGKAGVGGGMEPLWNGEFTRYVCTCVGLQGCGVVGVAGWLIGAGVWRWVAVEVGG